MQNKAIYTETVKCKSRTFFLDVKNTVKGGRMLQLTETHTDKDGNKQTSRFAVFEEQIPDFAAALAKVLDQFTLPVQSA